MKCTICGTEYEGHHKSLYCSDVCREMKEPAPLPVVNEAGTVLVETPEGFQLKVPPNYGKVGCGCLHCRHPKVQSGQVVLNHGAFKHAHELGLGEINRVSLQGDVDFAG